MLYIPGILLPVPVMQHATQHPGICNYLSLADKEKS